jgi:transcription elongation factor Elf1
MNEKSGKSKAKKKPKGRLLSKELRKCPSCKLFMIETRLYGSKISVQCKNCFLTYNYTNYPAFIEIDYYYKMREAFSQDVKLLLLLGELWVHVLYAKSVLLQ